MSLVVINAFYSYLYVYYKNIIIIIGADDHLFVLANTRSSSGTARTSGTGGAGLMLMSITLHVDQLVDGLFLHISTYLLRRNVPRFFILHPSLPL